MPAEVQQGIGRAAAVLEVIGKSTHGPLRASDIARATGLGASTMARLLTTLEELGYVAKVGDTQGYTIGSALMRLASEGLNQNPVHREARPVAQDLAQRTGFSANVAVRDGGSLVYLCHFEGARAQKSHTMVGMSQPLNASALGKCLLLDTTLEQRRGILGDELPSFTVNTISTHQALTEELARVRDRGAAIEDQELALGRLCVAAPIRDASGDVVAAISISGRLTLMRDRGVDQSLEDVVEAADRISVGLGLITAIAS
jgi:IclR family transcriptional regulator, acetate operon repressor